MEEKIDWKNAKFNPKSVTHGKSEDQIKIEFQEYCSKNISEAEVKLSIADYDKTLAWLDTFGITDIAVANRIFSECKALLGDSEEKKETSPKEPTSDDFDALDEYEEIEIPKVDKPKEAAPVAKHKPNYSEEMSEFKKLEEDFFGKSL